MGGASERLLQLHPVTFRYKHPNVLGEKPIQYGLIAEEVAEVFPELVVLNKDGQPESVAYHLLPSLLLNELQKEHKQVTLQQKRLVAQASQLSQLKQQFAQLQQAHHTMEVALMKLQAKGELLVQH
jgi:hypothetical protein